VTRGKVLASVAAVMVVGATVWVVAPWRAHTAHAGALHGTFSLKGCDAKASELSLSAVAVDSGGIRQSPAGAPPTTTVSPTSTSSTTTTVPPTTVSTPTTTSTPTTLPTTTVPPTTLPTTTVSPTTRRTVPPTTASPTPDGPVVSGLRPSRGTGLNTLVSVIGHGFGGSPIVHFGSALGLRASAVSDTQIDVLAPAGSGSVHVTVTAGGLTSATSPADLFTYLSAGFGPPATAPAVALLRTPVRRAAADTIAATITSIGDGSFAYEFPASTPGATYRLHPALGAACKGAHVRGPVGGYVVAGFAPIDIDAQVDGQLQIYAGTTKLIHTNGQLRDNWSIQDDVWPNSAGASRILHWSSGAPGTASGEWQVSTQPLGDACASAVGLVATGTAPFVPGALTPTKVDTDFPVDLAAIGKKLEKVDDTFADAPKAGGLGSAAAPTTTVGGPGGKALGGNNPAAPLPQVPPVPQVVPFTGNLYVRVLPLRADGSCSGPATNEVTISYGISGSTPLGPSKLQVLSGSGQFDSSFNHLSWDWGTSLDFEWNNLPATFRWSTAGTDTQTGEWQISTEPFVAGCGDSPSLEYTGEAAYAPGPLVNSGNADTDRADGHVFTIDFPSITVKGALTLYVRVVPRGNDPHQCSAQPTNSIMLHFQKPPSQPPIPSPPPPKPTAAMDLRVRTYQPFAPANPDIPSVKLCFISIVDHTLNDPFAGIKDPNLYQDVISAEAYFAGYRQFTAGQSFCFSPPGPPDPSFFDEVANFVSAVVSFPAQVYDLYKQVLPGVLGSILTQVLGVPGCAPPEGKDPPGKCYQALVAAQDIGLAALGLPPSLPDIGALLDDGEDELASEITAQLNDVGVPADASQVKAGLDTAKGALVAAFAGAANAAQGIDCQDHGATWCAFDTGTRSPSVTVQVTRHAESTVPIPNSVCVGANALYLSSCSPIPALAPGQTSLVRIKLRPLVMSPYDTKYWDVYNKEYGACSQQGLQPDEGCDVHARRGMEQTWEGDATNGSTPTLTLALFTLTAPTEPGSSWSSVQVGTTAGCGGNGSPPPAASTASCG
jgi:hypothetical protein